MAGILGAQIGAADRKTVDKAQMQRWLRLGKKIHRSELPELPQLYKGIRGHPLEEQFRQAERDHLQSHAEMSSWQEITKTQISCQSHEVLDCMWVYVYKTDKHGRFQKCKARLVVRGDQQAINSREDTYAATLAGRSFRTLMAIAARFDLELVQYDAVNAFVNARLPTPVYMEMPRGYRKPGTLLELQKALYGLRISPLLWQKELSTTLISLGWKSIPHEPCCFMRNGVLLFFYVDDIIIAYRKRKEEDVHEQIRLVRERYNLTGGHQLHWFLGLEVVRDREKGLIWLSQSAYIDKISRLIDDHRIRHDIPMIGQELLPYSGKAGPSDIQRYQRKNGSLLYAAVNTRPDIAFAVSRVARFLINPGPEHHRAADQILLYLLKTKSLALALGGGDTFVVASDASFADNSLDRKSSQAYAMKLFGGLIGWRASKQETVTTSTTEAELLALSQAAKESIYVSRLLCELSIGLDDHTIEIHCDNQQTIGLVNKEIATLQTRLRHVDIHNHWLRQEADAKRIRVIYKPTNDMIADGLTKSLPRGKWPGFLSQIGMQDISDRLSAREQTLEEIDALTAMLEPLELEN